MPTKRSEKVKLYLVIALAVAAALVAYFSFVHKGKATPVKVAGRPPQEVKYKGYKIEKTRPQRLQATRFSSAEPLNLDIRDIFAPVELPAEPEPAVETKKEQTIKKIAKQIPAPTVTLDLQGTILGGKIPLAIINDKFFKVGQKIGDYQIVRITPNTVYLKAGRHRKVIWVLNPAHK